MTILERLDKAAVHFEAKGRRLRSSPFAYPWTSDDTRQLLEDAAKEIRKRSKGFGQYVEDRAKKMTDLTDDERTVLMIAAEGQSMMAIARWEKPVESLIQKGLMVRGDKFNNFITDAGRALIKETEDEPYRKILETGIKLRNAHEQARQSAEQAAQHLMLAAKASAAIGNSPQFAAQQWSKIVLDRALELLNQ